MNAGSLIRTNHLSGPHVLDIKGQIFKYNMIFPFQPCSQKLPPPLPQRLQPQGYYECMENDMFKSTRSKALFCWSSVLNYCPLPGCSLPRSPVFSQTSSLPLHVKLYTTLTQRNGAQKQPVTPGSRDLLHTGGTSAKKGNIASLLQEGPLER